MSKKKLDLIGLAAGEVAEPRAAASRTTSHSTFEHGVIPLAS
jgi:hypothetical protein